MIGRLLSRIAKSAMPTHGHGPEQPVERPEQPVAERQHDQQPQPLEQPDAGDAEFHQGPGQVPIDHDQVDFGVRLGNQRQRLPGKQPHRPGTAARDALEHQFERAPLRADGSDDVQVGLQRVVRCAFRAIAQLAETNRQAAIEHHIQLVGEIPGSLAAETRVEVKRSDLGLTRPGRVHEAEHGSARRIAPERVGFRGRLSSRLSGWRRLSSPRGAGTGLRRDGPEVQRQRYQDSRQRVRNTMRDAPRSGGLVLGGWLEQHVPALAIAARSA